MTYRICPSCGCTCGVDDDGRLYSHFKFKGIIGSICPGSNTLMPTINYEALVRKAMEDHLRVAGQYERGGNIYGCMCLRYVANMLAAILRGEEASTIFPETEPSEVATK